MTKLIMILTFCILLISCSKPKLKEVAPVKKQFTAIVNVAPTSETINYDIFLSDDGGKNWIWALRVTKGGRYDFDFAGLVCNGILYADPKKKLIGCSREYDGGNKFKELDLKTVLVIKN